MKEKYLPIGTIVNLKVVDEKVMITGFCQMDIETKTVYDYCGCFYPEGYIESDKHILFNHTEVDSIIYNGYADEEEREFKENLKKFVENDLEKEIEQLEI